MTDTHKDKPWQRAGDHISDSIEREHGKGVAPGEQISPFGDGMGHIPAVDTVFKKITILDTRATDPTQDASADGDENLTEEEK